MTTRHIARRTSTGNRRVRQSGGAGLRPRARWWQAGAIGVIVIIVTMAAGVGTQVLAQEASPAVTPAASPQASPMMATPEASQGPATLFIAGKVTIEISDDGFSPTYFESAVGRDIEFTIVNTGTQPHNFTMEKADIDIDVDPGESVTVKLDAPDLGTYPYTSDLPGDEDMSGKMTVFI